MTRLKSGQIALGIVCVLFNTSCFLSKAEGQQRASDIDRLKNEIATLQRDQTDSEIMLDERLLALENVTFKKAASEGAESEKLKKELEDLRAQLEETQKSL